MAACILTKSNGLSIAAALCLLFIIHAYSTYHNKLRFAQQKIKLRNNFFVILGFITLSLSINFGDNVYYFLAGKSSDWLLSNVSTVINSGLKVQNTITSYMVFDLATYLQHPFISTWDDISGRQYFWNFVWRSTLTSEFSFNGEAFKLWGTINGVLLLAMLSSIVIYLLQRQPNISMHTIKLNAYKNLPWILLLVFPFILLLAYRIKVPLSCNTDFRYIYPVLVTIVYFSSLPLSEPKKYPIPALLSIAGILIAASSFIFIFLK
ncbi:MAG: hypothetical protein K2P99_01440 [Burkholderiales bacterium]|nr:hypothetical protein [Burkholderiales bacterium]